MAETAATVAVLTTTGRQLLKFGFRVLLLVAGHYPWQGLLDEHLPPLQREFDDRLLLWGTEVSLGGDAVKRAGDHAAREETSYGLALLVEHVASIVHAYLSAPEGGSDPLAAPVTGEVEPD